MSVEGSKSFEIRLHRNGRDVFLPGPGGAERECSLVPSDFPGEGEKQASLPVLLGAGSGAALSLICRRLAAAYGNAFHLAVVEKEPEVLASLASHPCFAAFPGITLVKEDDPNDAVRALSALQNTLGGLPFHPLQNPLYLRFDREYFAPLQKACAASAKADFWSQARYPKFAENPRLLLLTSKYFLMGEIQAALERLGIAHRLLQVPDGETARSEFVESLLTAVLEFKPDFVFTINHLGVDREGVLADLLERLRLPLASWFVDNPHLVLHLYERLKNPWTTLFTWDEDNLASLRGLGFEHVRYLPLGADTVRFAFPSKGPALEGLPKGWNGGISFVGNSMVTKVLKRKEAEEYPAPLADAYKELAAGFAADEERSVVRYMEKARPDLFPLFEGMERAEQRLAYETMLTWEATLQYRLACVKAVQPFSPLIVGDKGWNELLPVTPKWHYHSELNYYSDLPRFYPLARINFNCTSRQMKGAVNQRVFDVPACGAFLLTDYQEQAEKLFDPGTEIVCYRSPEEASDLAARFLAAPKEREAVSKAARKRVLAHHTYEHRVRELIDSMRRIYG